MNPLLECSEAPFSSHYVVLRNLLDRWGWGIPSSSFLGLSGEEEPVAAPGCFAGQGATISSNSLIRAWILQGEDRGLLSRTWGQNRILSWEGKIMPGGNTSVASCKLSRGSLRASTSALLHSISAQHWRLQGPGSLWDTVARKWLRFL